MLGYLVIMFVVFGRGLGNDGICSVVCDLCQVLIPHVKADNCFTKEGLSPSPNYQDQFYATSDTSEHHVLI